MSASVPPKRQEVNILISLNRKHKDNTTEHPALYCEIYLNEKTGLARHPVKGKYYFL